MKEYEQRWNKENWKRSNALKMKKEVGKNEGKRPSSGINALCFFGHVTI